MSFNEMPRHTNPIEPGEEQEMLLKRLAEDERLDKGEKIVREVFGDTADSVLAKISNGDELTDEEKAKMAEVREKMGTIGNA